MKSVVALAVVVACLLGSAQASGISAALNEWSQLNGVARESDASFIEGVEDIKGDKLEDMIAKIEDLSAEEHNDLTAPAPLEPLEQAAEPMRFAEARTMATTQAQTGTSTSLKARTKARAKVQFLGYLADAVNIGGNFIMDKMGVDPDSTGRKIFDAVTDPVGTAVGMGMDALGVPEDSPLRTAADLATYAVCFAGDTPITMADGSTKNAADIVIGDVTKGGRVTGTMQFAAPSVLYEYRGVVVAGHHKVLENGEFVAVKDSAAAVVSNRVETVVFDFDTTEHLIFVGDVTFADFSEVQAMPEVDQMETNELNL